ncbi:MAG: hypothetical protein Q8N46_00590 [Anaerolineales bacterium]|nr:hypothetical protein [Anaerolineales bacterium]
MKHVVCSIFFIETGIFVGVGNPHRFTVGHNPPGNAVIQRDDQAAHGLQVEVGCHLKIQLAGGVSVEQDGGRLGFSDIGGGADDAVE